jgi:transposase-like protein
MATPKLTSDQYARKEGIQCPFCESYSVIAGDINSYGSTAHQEASCSNCGETWDDEFKLVGYYIA